MKTECTYGTMNASGSWESQTFHHPRGFVFEGENARELVKVPAPEKQRASAAVNYHSLVVETGGSVKRFREFVVFHREYVYPEFVVAYQRTDRSADEPEPEPEPEPLGAPPRGQAPVPSSSAD